MCLRFVFLLITRTASWLRLSQREETWKIAEILLLRHQLAVLQRRQPRRPDFGLGGPGPTRGPAQRDTETRRQRLGLLVTPGTIVRWHRDIVRRRWAARSIRGKTGRPATRRNIKALVLRSLAYVLTSRFPAARLGFMQGALGRACLPVCCERLTCDDA